MKKKVVAIALVAKFTNTGIAQAADVTAFNLTSRPITRTLTQPDTSGILGGNLSALFNGSDDL